MRDWLKVYAVSISICAIFILSAFLVLFFHGEYDTKILVKLGIKEPEVKTNWAVKGWNNMLEKMDYDADIVFFGDSITSGSDFRAYFPNEKIVVSGYPGDSLIGMKERVAGIAAVVPEKVFVLGGINGLKDGKVEQSVSLYRQLLVELKDSLPDTEIYIQSVLPISKEKETTVCQNSTIMAFNNRLAQLAEENKMTYVDLYSAYEWNGEMNPNHTRDGVHLKTEAYACWASIIAEYID